VAIIVDNLMGAANAMIFREGSKPEWKGKPKASPLDTDVVFLKLRNEILQGRFKPFEGKWIEIHDEADGARLQTKNPARLVRDHLRRILKDANLEPDYVVSCRQTATPGVWGVWVVREPRESAVAIKRIEESENDGRRRTRHPQEKS
jgi:hypothetical protein